MNRLHQSFRLLLILVWTTLYVGCGDRGTQAEADMDAPSENASAQDDDHANSQVDDITDASNQDDSEANEHVQHGPNHLADETSPYLLMHAHNPVDWYPWGEEALQKAKDENKLIFLSVGYSSCHWCHVMERESFLDEEIAAYLNEHFVCIKVDREERPDIDNIYMRSLYVYQALANGRQNGGWPLSMFLTPDAHPFFGLTYLPAHDGDRGAAMGFHTLIQRISEVWVADEESIRGDAEVIANATRRELAGIAPESSFKIETSLVHRAQAMIATEFDPSFGGFGYSAVNSRIPKFPQPSILLFLLELAKESPDEDVASSSRQMLLLTLDRMSMGGIRDHLGGGFHRYSVDRFWMIPHFEKMLYDNGQLATLYAEAYVLTGDPAYRQIVFEMLDFVSREMQSEEGGFYSALDAESEGEEGKFYRWEIEEVKAILGDDDFALFAEVYAMDGEPNFESHYAPQFDEPLAAVAQRHEMTLEELEKVLAPMRQKLLAERESRERPLTDTKMLTSWNGLMIRGFADAGRLLEEPRFIATAERAAEMVLDKLRTEDGRLLRTYGAGEAKLNAYLTDYAFLIDGLIALHQATGNERWLTVADELMRKQLDLFWDDSIGGFFFTSTDHESLLARAKNPVDQAEPAGSSVSAQNLLYLAEHLGRVAYVDRARETVMSVSGLLDRSPSASPRLLIAVRKLIALDEQDGDPEDDPSNDESGAETDSDADADADANADQDSDADTDSDDASDDGAVVADGCSCEGVEAR